MTGKYSESVDSTFSNDRCLAAQFLGEDFEEILRGIPHAIIIGDRNGLIRANNHAMELLDIDPRFAVSQVQDLIARSNLKHTDRGCSVADCDHPFVKALSGQASACDASLEDPRTERMLSMRCHGQPLRRNGALVGAMAIYSDISDFRRTTEALNRTNQELREFSAILAHDLKEPLRMIANFLDLACHRESVRQDEKAVHYLTFSAASARRMRSLIDDLLELTHVGRPLRRSHTQVNVVVGEALDNLAMALRERQAEVVFSDLPEVYADSVQLMLVFQNLLSNAIKYSDDVRPLRIHITAEKREGDTLFAVSDNGIGIASQDCQRIFAPFDRLQAKSGAEGSGLGLTICKRVVSRHRGEIWAESGPEFGAVFKFTIPHHDEDGVLEPKTTGEKTRSGGNA